MPRDFGYMNGVILRESVPYKRNKQRKNKVKNMTSIRVGIDGVTSFPCESNNVHHLQQAVFVMMAAVIQTKLNCK